MEGNRIPLQSIIYEFEKRLRGRTRNRWQDEVIEEWRLVGGKVWQEGVYNKGGMEEALENG